MKKKQKEKIIIEDLEITSFAAEGKAIGKKDGFVIFVPYAIPGDIVDVEVFRKKKNYAEANIINIKKESADRILPLCEHFGICGGCKWQNLDYSKQLWYKQQMVDEHFRHIGKFEFPPFDPIIPSQKKYYYRNKLEFTFTQNRWLEHDDFILQKRGENVDTCGLGFHIPGKFDKILDIKRCFLQEEPSNEIRLSIKKFAAAHHIPFYDIRNHEGILRNMLIRTSSTGELMVVVIFKKDSIYTKLLMDYILQEFPQINSLQYVINPKVNDSITDLETVLYHGTPYILEKIDNLTFQLSALSFFQTNYEQMYALYTMIKKFASISPTDIVYDLYSGIGTISCFIAKNAQKVVGIEYIDVAIENAKLNARINQINNTSFFAGDIAKILTTDFVQKNGLPDIVITDPPRAGMHPKVVNQLLEICPEKIVYVSCNSATQARDLTLLAEKYNITKVQPIDMFPQTQHVENFVLLERK